MQTFTHVINDPMGLHARPAGLLVKVAGKLPCAVTLTTETGKADAKRIMAVMRLAAKQGTTLMVTCDGEGEEAAAAELKQFLAENL